MTNRPVFLNLARIQMPVGALTSITHRVTGILLALVVAAGFYLLELSLRDAESFAQAREWVRSWPFKAAGILSAWALGHHVLAGLRHMLMDIDVGSRLPAARRSAWAVNVGGLLVALLAAGAML